MTGFVIGGGGAKKNCAAFLYHSYISKGYYLVGLHKYICILLYSLSYEPILTLLLCTDLYVAIFKLLKSLGWQNIPLFLQPWATVETRTIIDESLIQSAKIEATTTAITITTTTITTYDHSIHTYITSLSVSTTTATTYDHSIHTYITSLWVSALRLKTATVWAYNEMIGGLWLAGWC